MAEFDNKFLYNMLAQKYGIDPKELEELDVSDNKPDGRVNGLSMFFVLNNIVKKYGNNNVEFIMKELNNVSIMMNNRLQSKNLQTNTSEQSNVPKHNSSNADKIVKKLIDEIFKFGFADIEKPIYDINANNVVDVLEKYQKESDKKNSISGKVMDHETLFEAILDESIPDIKKKKYINHIKDALVQKINQLGGSALVVGELFSEAIDTAMKNFWPFQDSSMLDKLANKCIETIKRLERMHRAGESVETSDLYEFNQSFLDYLKDEFGLSIEDLYGNGKFDNEALQVGNNCWIHASLNGMLNIPRGREYLENLVTKSSNNNIVVYLPGAKDKHIPKPKGDGIFVYTPDQILSEGTYEESVGEGDYTAVCLAIRDYLREANNDPNLTTTGGNIYDFGNIILGENNYTCRMLGSRLDPSYKEDATKARRLLKQAKDTLSNKDKHILRTIASYDSINDMYKNIKDAFEAQKGIMYVSISGANYFRLLEGKPVVPDNNCGHAMTIISMTNSKVVLKDSNNPNTPITMSASDFIKTCTINCIEF